MHLNSLFVHFAHTFNMAACYDNSSLTSLDLMYILSSWNKETALSDS